MSDRTVEIDVQALGNADALRLLIETLDTNGLPDAHQVRVTAGFMRGLSAQLAGTTEALAWIANWGDSQPRQVLIDRARRAVSPADTTEGTG